VPVNIDEMTSDVAVYEGELPLNQKQIDRLVALVLQHLERKQREEQSSREATRLRRQAAPPMQIAD
jgi:hypothetical protein